MFGANGCHWVPSRVADVWVRQVFMSMGTKQGVRKGEEGEESVGQSPGAGQSHGAG